MPIPSLIPHPETGATYIFVLDDIPAFSEIRASYASISTPWLAVISAAEAPAVFGHYRDTRSMFINWMFLRTIAAPLDRRARIVAVYDEAMDSDLNRLMPSHLGWWNSFVTSTRNYDGFLCNTPWMAAQISTRLNRPTAVLPVGYEPAVLGVPDWNAAKTHDACWYGSMVPRRARLLEQLKKRLRLDVATGCYAGATSARLNTSRAALYVGHSEINSYSTRRIWQTIASSAALVTEPGDYWPLTRELVVEVPRLSHGATPMIEAVVSLSAEEALRIARAAHETLRGWSVMHCLENYLIPATSGWLQ